MVCVHVLAGRKQALVQVLEVAEFLHGQGLAHRALSLETIAWSVCLEQH